MCAYIDGDVEAFEVLYGRHKNRVFGFLLARLKDPSEAEDVFQTIFSKLHSGRHTYRQEIPFLPWLFTITRNSLIDHVRKKGTYDKLITASPSAVDACAAPEAGPAPIHTAFTELARLSDSQRNALELRFDQGLTFVEIADQMQTSAGNARQIISRAIRKLRRLMSDKGETP